MELHHFVQIMEAVYVKSVLVLNYEIHMYLYISNFKIVIMLSRACVLWSYFDIMCHYCSL
jgi:hypothetical protein